jgi:deoxyadenosine/deoxycytidine kinase
MAATQILVISGPIASGKSSTAQLLAAKCFRGEKQACRAWF